MLPYMIFGSMLAAIAGELTNLGKNIYIIKSHHFLAGDSAQIVKVNPPNSQY
jgi:hypothetical protein